MRPIVATIRLLNDLVVLAGLSLLINRTYPRTLFNLVLGINPWLYRVLTYVALMHDDYPSFHLEQGPDEPVLTRSTTPSPTTDAAVAHAMVDVATPSREAQL